MSTMIAVTGWVVFAATALVALRMLKLSRDYGTEKYLESVQARWDLDDEQHARAASEDDAQGLADAALGLTQKVLDFRRANETLFHQLQERDGIIESWKVTYWEMVGEYDTRIEELEGTEPDDSPIEDTCSHDVSVMVDCHECTEDEVEYLATPKEHDLDWLRSEGVEWS